MAKIKNPTVIMGGAKNLQTKTVTPTASGFDVEPDAGYDALEKVTLNGDADLIPGNVKQGVQIFGVEGSFEGMELQPLTTPAQEAEVLSGKQYYDDEGAAHTGSMVVQQGDLDGLVDGTVTSFSMPTGKTKIWQYRFYLMTALVTLVLTGVTEIGLSAFQGCTGLLSVTLPSTLTTMASSIFQACTGLTTLVVSNGMTTLGVNMFYGCTYLASVTLPNTLKTINAYCFYQCTRIVNLTIPGSVNNIGNYAFYQVGNSSGSTFVLEPDETCTVGSYAFQSSKLSKIDGLFGSIGSYAFASCTSLTEANIGACSALNTYAFSGDTNLAIVSLKINGGIYDYAFNQCNTLREFTLDPSSVVSYIGAYAFSRCGYGRTSPSTNVLTYDLRNGTFTNIPTYAWGYSSSSYRNQYEKIFFPATLASIAGYAFRYSNYCEYYFTSDAPPTLSATTCWSNATNYKLFVPYNSIDAYRKKTNWTAQASYIKGYAPANTFTLGATLPIANTECYGLTWYSDSACTTAVTTVSDAGAIYFCVAGTVKLYYQIKKITAVDCTIVISDGTNTYSLNDFVATGTVLSITGTPTTAGWSPYIFTLNGSDFTNGGNYTVADDMSITALYWDGTNVPADPVFENNPWSLIRQIFRAGTASVFWNVGDTKSVTLSDNSVFTLRIADMQTGRYQLADGSGASNGVLEWTVQFPATYPMNSTMKNGYWNGGGWAMCDMKNTTMATLFAMLPSDLQDAISEVVVNSGTGGGTTSGASSSNNKLFLPSEYEMYGAKSISIGDSEGTPQFDYYIGKGNSARVKQRSGSVQWYWLRSPYSGYSNAFEVVNSDGSVNVSNAVNTGGVAPCFAI